MGQGRRWLDGRFYQQGFRHSREPYGRISESLIFLIRFSYVFNIPEYFLNDVDVKFEYLISRKTRTTLYLWYKNGNGQNIKKDGLTARKVRLNPIILLAHAAALSQGSVQYYFTRTEIKSKTLAAGTNSQSFDDIYLGA